MELKDKLRMMFQQQREAAALKNVNVDQFGGKAADVIVNERVSNNLKDIGNQTLKQQLQAEIDNIMRNPAYQPDPRFNESQGTDLGTIMLEQYRKGLLKDRGIK